MEYSKVLKQKGGLASVVSARKGRANADSRLVSPGTGPSDVLFKSVEKQMTGPPYSDNSLLEAAGRWQTRDSVSVL